MGRRLILMRHAKSDWSGGLDDHERPLNGRGRQSAPDVAEQLAGLGWTPELVVSSDSARTTETWALMAPALPHAEVKLTRRLYLPSVQAIGRVIGGLPDEVVTAMLVGHNPGFSEAVEWLTGEGIDLKTANAALLETTVEGWEKAVDKRGRWSLVDVVVPDRR
jgi:phosphohistidine phosphatase